MKNLNKKKLRAIFKLYGSKFLHQILDIEKRLQATAELTRPKLILILVSCINFSGMTKSLFSRKPFTPITWIINGLFSITGLIMTVVLFSLVISAIYILYRYNGQFSNEYDEERNLTRSAEGTHGTASFLEGDEIKEVYGLLPPNDIDNINGFLIGKVPNIAQNKGYIGDIVTRDEKLMADNFLSNRNTVIIGSPGTGKSASIMIQNLIESAKKGLSVFVTDPKGELCDITSPIFRELGYDVKVFNLIYPWHSNKWNFMEWLSTLGADQEGWVGKISSMIIQNTSGPKSDTFWDSNADKLLKALMSFLLEIATPKSRVKDTKLNEYAMKLQELRQLRNHSDTLDEKDMIDGQIEAVIKEKYKYISARVKQLKQRIDECKSPKEKERLTKLYYKLSAYRNDEALLPILDKSNPPEDYEPLTLAEAKHRILNISTCVRLLQLRISLTKEEQASMAAWYALPRAEKLNRLLYELTFKVPYEQRSYKALMQVFSLCDPNHSLAFSYYSSFTESSENLCTSVKGGLDTRLSAFNQHYIRQMTSENEIDLEKPGREKCAYFCIISDQESSLAYISSLFITIAFTTLQVQADANKNRKLQVRTMFYLDEFANIGILYEYTKKLSTLRSRDMHIIMAVQNLPQLLQRYDENLCLEMFGDCETFIFLGCGNETKTPEFVSKLMGQMTTSTVIKRESKNILSPIKDLDYQFSEQQSQRDLMFLSEIRELKKNRLIVITSGQKPMQVDKFMYFKRPDFQWIKETMDKYPAISGHPLPKEEDIDIDALLTHYMNDITLFESLEQGIRRESVSEADTIADEINEQMESIYRKEQLRETGQEFRRLREEWRDNPEEFRKLVQDYFNLSEERSYPDEQFHLSEEYPSTSAQAELRQESPTKSAGDSQTESVKDGTSVSEIVDDGFTPMDKSSDAHGSDTSPAEQEQQQAKTTQIKKKLRQKSLNGLQKTDPKDI